MIFPEIPLHIHHYYELSEMNWCEKNDDQIDRALRECLKEPDPDPWRFYSPGLIEKGSPSRIHYYWAAKKIHEWIQANSGMTLLGAHGLPAEEIGAF
jgi:hypothetical protein